MTLREIIERRPVVFDGAMGTQIQRHQLKASDFGGKEGANDLLSVTRPDLVEEIHARYLDAGCDVVETNTFGSSRLKLDEYGLGHRTYEVNFRAAILARRAVERFSTPDHPRFVAGSIGPTGMLPSSSDPALGNITGDALERIFVEQARGAGGGRGRRPPHRDPAGHAGAPGRGAGGRRRPPRGAARRAAHRPADAHRRRTAACCSAPTSARPWPRWSGCRSTAIGLNCSTGPAEMRGSVRYLAERCSHFVSVLPNAGMPENEDGRAVYKLSPARTWPRRWPSFVGEYGVDIVGGCCGTTPEHLRAVVERLRALPPRRRTRPAARRPSSPRP